MVYGRKNAHYRFQNLRQGSGHTGGTFSIMDITAVLEGGTGGSASQLHNYFL